MPASEALIPVPGGRLVAHEAGQGSPIVLLHADIVDSRAWDPMTPYLVEAGFRVVAYERRGFDGSTTDDVAFSNRADVVALLDVLGIERACLVGNSIGSIIALDVAIESPERVVAVVAVAPGISGYWPPEPAGVEAELFAESERLEGIGDDPDAIVDLHVRLWVDGPGQPPDRVPAPVREAVREMDRAINAPGRVTGRPIPLDPPAIERLDDLSIPLLAISGALDAAETAAAAGIIEQRVSSARTVVMPGVAHLIGLEAPQELAELIVDFLAPLGRWR